MTIPTPVAALSKKTRLLVTALIEADGKILNWEELRDAVYGKGMAVGDGDLGEFMRRLAGRSARLLKDNGHPDLAKCVESVRGVGYRWSGGSIPPPVPAKVERVARAIWEAGWPEPPTMKRNLWENMRTAERAPCMRMAVAAIAAAETGEI